MDLVTSITPFFLPVHSCAPSAYKKIIDKSSIRFDNYNWLLFLLILQNDKKCARVCVFAILSCTKCCVTKPLLMIYYNITASHTPPFKKEKKEKGPGEHFWIIELHKQ
jgi:hypothetical protein